MSVTVGTATLAIYVDLFREHARTVASAVAATFREAGYAIALCEDQDYALGIATDGAALDAAELLVTVGGDGTLLRAAQIAVPRGIPLLGINTGHLGFLTELEGADPGTPAALLAMVRAGVTVDERTALGLAVGELRRFALNDVVVTRTRPHMTPFGLYVDGREAAHVPADGIVIATPTGSTAYSLSAGGPILTPAVDAFILNALLPHTLFSRPLVVPSSSTIEIVCDDETTGVALEADGVEIGALGPGDRVHVERYPMPVRFARRGPVDFFAVLEGKLRWNAPVKR